MKKPTIKATNRAYVRLYERVVAQGSWEDFLAEYTVQMLEYGMRRSGGCAVEVRNRAGEPADLGPYIPNRITYNTFIAPDRTTWQEHFRDGGRTWSQAESR